MDILGVFDFLGRSDQHGLLGIWHLIPTVGAFDEAGIEGDDFEEAAYPEFLFQEELGDLRFREADGGLDEELAGVVAGLAVDVDGADEVGGFRLRCFIVKFSGMSVMFSVEIGSAARD